MNKNTIYKSKKNNKNNNIKSKKITVNKKKKIIKNPRTI